MPETANFEVERKFNVTSMLKSQLDKLVMMGNQIAQFFGSYPHDEAVAGTASHIEAFWTPRMIQALKDGLDQVDNPNPILREALSPQVAAQDPAEKSAKGPGKVGELGAVDAG